MKKSLHKVFVALLIGVFVNFVFANTVFVHTHTGLDGRAVTHSHPYLPSSGHTHSAASLSLIAAFNAAAAAFEGSYVTPMFVHDACFGCVSDRLRCDCVALKADARVLRGPPLLG